MAKDVCFSSGSKYADGGQTSVGINKHGIAVEVHKSHDVDRLCYHTGKMEQLILTWSGSTEYDDGYYPAIALNDKNVVVEIHGSRNKSKLWYRVGIVSGNSISFGPSHDYAEGSSYSIALDNDNCCVEVHRDYNKRKLYYQVGLINEHKNIDWGPSLYYDTGGLPHVCVNNHGVVVEVHESEHGDNLFFRVGVINKNARTIDWGNPQKHDIGHQPVIAITDSNFVIEMHESKYRGELYRHVGKVNDSKRTIESFDKSFSGKGLSPSVACAFDGSIAVQTNKSEWSDTLWSSTSLIQDRSRWMQLNMPAIASKCLKHILMPAAHDAGMYKEHILPFVQTQDLNIFDQLSSGVRYFDLRPGWDGNDLFIFHGGEKGVLVTDVLGDVRRFMESNATELVILVFNNYYNFKDEYYDKLVNLVKCSIGKWLFTELPSGKRLADVTMGEYIADSGKIIVACNDDYPVKRRNEGIWVYRDYDRGDADRGDLRVFNMYSNTTEYEKMKTDQIRKFNNFNGRCEKFPDLPCDLFLLSWTLTPVPGERCAVPNSGLSSAMALLAVPNPHGVYLNMMFLDFVENSQVTDIAVLMNARQQQLAAQGMG